MNILLVDDDRDSVRSVRRFLTKIGHQVCECISDTNNFHRQNFFCKFRKNIAMIK